MRIRKDLIKKPYVAQRRSEKQEMECADRLGGTLVSGSGSGQVRGDVRVTGILRLENKCTAKKSFSITREMVEKIENAALMSGEVPAIQVEFLDEAGRVLHRLCVVPDYVLDTIVGVSGV